MPAKRIAKLLSGLRGDKSGNAMMLVAMGAPILFGTTGLGVDTAQWYMWQRELQYAADQAALAGAWSRGNGDTGSEYATRARQEFAANVRIVNNYTTLDSPSLTNYDDGDPDTTDTDNSVVVTASTTGTLPFANLILGTSTTVRVRAQATYETTQPWTACLLSLDEHASRSMWFRGGPSVNAGCGIGAISDADDAVTIGSGAGTYDIGWALSGGGVDDAHGALGDADIVENMEELFDPFADLTPPDNPTARSLNCGGAAGTWTADRSTSVTITYSYFRGQNANQAEPYNAFADAKPNETPTPEMSPGGTYTSEPTDSTSTTSTGKYQVSGSGPDKIFEEKTTVTTIAYTNVDMESGNNGSMPPGTYAGFDIHCDTTLSGGIYVIDGGMLNVNAQYSLTGSGVMFVLKNGAGVQINGGAEINLTPMDASQLIAHGVSAEEAERLAGMLIFEHPDSPGATGNIINGNASTNLDGIVYTPNSGMTLSGTMGAESSCLMIASLTLEIAGTANLTTMCDGGDFDEVVVGHGGTKVRLVA